MLARSCIKRKTKKKRKIFNNEMEFTHRYKMINVKVKETIFNDNIFYILLISL